MSRSKSTASPGSQAGLRVANQRRVLDLLLQADGPIPQSSIARETGLAGGTVSTIVRQLAGAGLLSTVAGAGRRSTSVALGEGTGVVGAVDVGHSHVGVAVADFTGTILGEERVRMKPTAAPDTALSTAEDLLDQVLRSLDLSRTAVRSIGLGLPAPIADGVVTASTILPGWVGMHVTDAAAAHFGVPVHFENDANLGALAEHTRGAGRHHRSSIFVKVSSGVGAGIVIDDEIWRGSNGTAGEIGHLTLDDQGPVCRCGSRGCLEAYASTGTVLSLVAEQLDTDTVDVVAAAALDGNVAARRVFEDAGLHLGWGLAALTNLLNPEVLIIGGDMAHAGDLLLEPARQGLRRHVLSGAENTPIVPAQLGDRATLTGALLLAIRQTDLLTLA